MERRAVLTFFARAAYPGGTGFSDQLVRPVAAAMQNIVRAIFVGAQQRGELRDDVDLDAAVRLVHALCITVSDVVLVPSLNDYYQLVDDRLPVEALHRETVAAICRAYGRPGAPTEETP